MKSKLFLLTFLLSQVSFGQIPTDAVAKYTFTNGSLVNVADAGNGDLTGGAVPANLLRTDRFNVANNAIRCEQIRRNGYVFTGVTNELSISFWIRGGAPTSGAQRVLHAFDSSGDGFTIRIQTGSTLVARFKNGGSDKTGSQSGSPVFNGSWHQVVLTIKKSNKGYTNRVFIDGALNSSLSAAISSTESSNFLSSNSTFTISPLTGSEAYFGLIDDIEIFERELHPLEIESIYLNKVPDAVFVNLNATGNNDGSSWADAYTDLQDAIDNTAVGKQIWVAKGTYFPSSFAVTSQQNNRDRTFLVNKGVFIYGGFDGTETSINQRDVTNNPTILSGDFNQDDTSALLPNTSNRQDNAYHVVTVKGFSSFNPLLDGFTITGGNANSTLVDVNCSTNSTQQFDKRRGAAIYMNLGAAGSTVALDVMNCTIEKNSATGMAVLHSFNPCGSGSTSSEVNFLSCVIRDNYSVDNSNIFYGASRFSIERYGSIVNSLVYDNFTLNQASAINLSADSSQRGNLGVSIINTTFTNNSSNTGKVMRFSQATGVQMYNTIIHDNANNDLDLIGSLPTTIANNIIEKGQLSGIDQNPLFTNSTAKDFTLQSGSPAIDSGDNTKIPPGINIDFLKNERIFNTTVDMGAYEFGASPLSIVKNPFTNSEIKVYPNPVSENLYVDINQEVQKIVVYNLLGKVVLEKENSAVVNLSPLKSGMYLIRVTSDKNLYFKRIIKN